LTYSWREEMKPLKALESLVNFPIEIKWIIFQIQIGRVQLLASFMVDSWIKYTVIYTYNCHIRLSTNETNNIHEICSYCVALKFYFMLVVNLPHNSFVFRLICLINFVTQIGSFFPRGPHAVITYSKFYFFKL
jgi:hypothetical protein